jgi:putative Mn2+ efflux pump MntP
MEIKNLFLFFGIAAAALAVIVSIIGLRSEKFPSPRAMYALLGLAFVLVVGTGFYAVELSIEEAKEREEHSKEVIGEEASITPLQAPARF